MVSVVVPSHNGERLIRRSIESVLSQGIDDLEVIVSDDGSTDATVAEVEGIADSRVRIVHAPPDRGAAANWNHGITQARGEYVKLLPQDDVLLPGSLRRQVSLLAANPGCVMVGSLRDVVDEEGRILFTGRGLGSLKTGVAARDEVVASVFRSGTNVIGEPGAVLFRRDATDAISFRDEDGYVVDLAYYVRLLEGGDFLADRSVAAQFTVHRQSWTATLDTSQVTDVVRWLSVARSELHVPAALFVRGVVLAFFNAVGRIAVFRITRLNTRRRSGWSRRSRSWSPWRRR